MCSSLDKTLSEPGKILVSQTLLILVGIYDLCSVAIRGNSRCDLLLEGIPDSHLYLKNKFCQFHSPLRSRLKPMRKGGERWKQVFNKGPGPYKSPKNP